MYIVAYFQIIKINLWGYVQFNYALECYNILFHFNKYSWKYKKYSQNGQNKLL